MARVDLPYARALLGAAPLGDVARAVLRRVRRAVPVAAPFLGAEARTAAADALGRAPRLFTTAPLDDSYARLFPDGVARLAERAGRILDHEVELFGRRVTLPLRIDWCADPFGGADPKGAWELARGAHLVELGAATRLCAPLAEAARAEIRAQMESFLDENRGGEGLHYASPLEVALRGIHWLGALELAGGAAAFPRSFVERLAGALLGDAHFLATHLEDGGVVPANHLLGDLVGLYVLALALDGAPGMQAQRTLAEAGLLRECARQVGSDGAHFEASTAYHRFALELLLTALRASRGAGARLSIGETLHHMFLYLRGTLGTDGLEPGFGDSDDARVLALVPRDPRDHGYLLSVGVALFGDPALKSESAAFSEEALWLGGPEAHRVWQWIPATADAPSASFPSGGVHVLRDRGLYAALRSGGYGQRGVGGHAHNDQLALVVHLDGRPLIVDSGTGSYTGDPVMRDRFRGTAAHPTVVVDGAEQSPILEGRPFALPDQARAPRVRLEDLGSIARVTGEHRGYLRLPAGVLHRRRVTLHRGEGLLIIEDELEGNGQVAVDVRFPLADEARSGAGAATRARLAELGALLGEVDPQRVVELGGRAALVPLGAPSLTVRLERASISPRYGSTVRAPLVTAFGLLTLPAMVRHAVLAIQEKK